MGNEEEKKGDNKEDKQINIKSENKIVTQKPSKENKDFQRFREIVLRYEYYTKLLKLSFKNNKILKILYKPESIFDSYYKQMFYILEGITYINYKECIRLTERSSYSPNKNTDKINLYNNSRKDLININKVKFDLTNSNKNLINIEKKNTTKIKNENSSKNIRSNIRKKSFDISLPEQTGSGLLFKYSNISGEKKLYHELIYIMEKICLYDIKKIQKILLLYPINNLRWIIWLAVARSKYHKTQNKMSISNHDIYNELINKIEIKNDSLMFELHNTLKELKVFKCNWSSCLYKIIKCLLQYKHDFKYETGMNILIGVPLLISDCNEEDTFFFARYLFSSYYGLGLCYFFGEDELLLNYLVFIVKYLTREKFPKIYNHLLTLNIADDLWIKKWIKTFFSSIFNLSITIRVWDCVIAVGLRFLVNYSLAIFDFFKERILQLKKVKYFLEFFDYDLKKKYIKTRDIMNFRENIIKLSQSYNIPDGKYQLIEKEYLDTLFKNRESLKSEHFDTSRTINNYYSTNSSYDEEQYHIKLILRTIIYIPSDYLRDNVEDKDIYKFKKKKTSKWLETQKSLKKIDEMEKDSEISYLEKHKNIYNNKISKNFGDLRLYSSNFGSEIDNKNDEVNNNESNNLTYIKNDNENSFNSINENKENSSNNKNDTIKTDKESNQSNNDENDIIKSNKEVNESNKNKKEIIKSNKENIFSNEIITSKKLVNDLIESNDILNINNNNGNSNKSNEENEESVQISIDNDNEFDLSFHDEQSPNDIKE